MSSMVTYENFYQHYDAADDTYSVFKIRISKVRHMVILHSELRGDLSFENFCLMLTQDAVVRVRALEAKLSQKTETQSFYMVHSLAS